MAERWRCNGLRRFAMIDTATTTGRLLTAALDVAGRKDWAAVTLIDIAEAAGASLAELRAVFTTKNDVIAALIDAVDAELLRRTPKRAEGQESRDLLFDAVMTRFDLLAPYKRALKSIYASGAHGLPLAGKHLASRYWMLQAAGIATDGASGVLRVAGLAVTYASVFRVWLEDDDPGLARTMAALDRRLRRGERAIASFDRLAGIVDRLAGEGPRILRTMLHGRPRPPTGGEPDAV
jgi:AcrR family transcriptional regulator